jgi:hypothetical protein
VTRSAANDWENVGSSAEKGRKKRFYQSIGGISRKNTYATFAPKQAFSLFERKPFRGAWPEAWKTKIPGLSTGDRNKSEVLRTARQN